MCDKFSVTDVMLENDEHQPSCTGHNSISISLIEPTFEPRHLWKAKYC